METMSFRIQLRFSLFKTHVPPFDPLTITWWSHGNKSFQEKVSAAHWLCKHHRVTHPNCTMNRWVKVGSSPEVLQIMTVPIWHTSHPFYPAIKRWHLDARSQSHSWGSFFFLFPCDSRFELKFFEMDFLVFTIIYLLLELAKSAPEIKSKIHPTSAKWAPIIEFALAGPEFSRTISRHSGEKEVRAEFKVFFNENQLDTTVFSITFSSLEILKEAPESCLKKSVHPIAIILVQQKNDQPSKPRGLSLPTVTPAFTRDLLIFRKYLDEGLDLFASIFSPLPDWQQKKFAPDKIDGWKMHFLFGKTYFPVLC